MKRFLYCAFILALVCCIYSCGLSSNSSKYTDTTKNFTDALLDSNYTACANLMNFDKAQKNIDHNQLRIGFDSLRIKIARDYGRKLEYSLMSAQKRAPEDASLTLPENTTLVYIELHNTQKIGVLKVLFDDKTGKIDNIQKVRLMQNVPDMTKFWLFGLMAAAIVAYNIYGLILVYKSQLTNKWAYYLAVIILNIPALEYHVMQGINLKIFAHQYYLGIYFQHIGYLGSVWAIGIPIGTMFVSLKLGLAESKQAKARKK